MPGSLFRSICAWGKAGKNRGLIILASGVLLGVGILLLILDYRESITEIKGGIIRNSYGKGSRIEELEVKDEDGKRSDIEVEIPEQSYSSEGIQKLFQRCISRIEKEILGENESLDHIDSDLDLIKEIAGEPVGVSWEIDRYDVMSVNGKLQEEALVPEGTMVCLRAVITYSKDPKEQALYECSAMVYPKTLNQEEQMSKDLKSEIKKMDESTKTQKIMELPGTLHGRALKYYYKMDKRGAVIMAMAVLIGILLYALEKQNQDQEKKKKNSQMRMDYPEIINKLTLFLGAGMTVKRAWRKIVYDYEEEKKVWGVHFAYEEMKQACYEMDSGIMESESYERFGRRCGLQEYIRLGALLSQNLRKGAKGLNQILKMEAVCAFEERKARAKRLGEEAGTKLLAPMFLMLAIVLVIVIVPAFLSIQL